MTATSDVTFRFWQFILFIAQSLLRLSGSVLRVRDFLLFLRIFFAWSRLPFVLLRAMPARYESPLK